MKFYFHKTDDGSNTIKSKGARNNFTEDNFKKLLDLGNIIYRKEKWYKSIIKGNIEKRDVHLNLKGGTLKRKLILKNTNNL